MHYSCFSKLAEEHEGKENKSHSRNIIVLVGSRRAEKKLVSAYGLSKFNKLLLYVNINYHLSYRNSG